MWPQGIPVPLNQIEMEWPNIIFKSPYTPCSIPLQGDHRILDLVLGFKGLKRVGSGRGELGSFGAVGCNEDP